MHDFAEWWWDLITILLTIATLAAILMGPKPQKVEKVHEVEEKKFVEESIMKPLIDEGKECSLIDIVPVKRNQTDITIEKCI
jgi:hypothetical protein